VTDKTKGACYGCLGVPRCKMIDWNCIMKDCPCAQCIVKVLCDGDCDDYIYYEDKFLPNRNYI
jgi:hypothetical protein